MKNPVFNLPDIFRKKASEALSNSTTEFPQLDLKELAKEWKVKEAGLYEGKKNIPVKEAKPYSAIELEVIATISGAVGERKNQAVSYVEDLERAFRGLTLSDLVANIKNFAANSRNEFQGIIENADEKLYRVKEDFESYYGNIKNFKKINGLKDKAHPPDSKTLFWGILAFEVIIETFFNFRFFKEISDSYILGGIQDAFMLSILNVLILGYIFGKKAFWYKNHINTTYVFLAKSSFLLFALLAFILNFFVMHYRVIAKNNFEPGLPFPMADIINNMHMFNTVPSLQDWFLFIIGFTAAFVAFFTSYKMDDPYPGYGDLQKDFDQARDDFNEAKSRIEQRLDNMKNEETKKIEGLVRKLQNQHALAISYLKDEQAYLTKWQFAYEYYQLVCTFLLKTYRQSNQAHRTEDAPDYFLEERFTFENTNPEFVNNIDEYEKILKQVTIYVDQIGNHLAEIEKDIINHYENALNRFSVIKDENKL